MDDYAATATAMWQSEEDADRAAAHLAQSYAFQSAAKALHAKAEDTGRD
ncbi:hypothetical protein [Ensifer sesbaniae]|nr:hypothetical protein [Ensifer sesbaniae]NRQ14605.1 hypothetical protein [Ensifer sesbaniae]